MFVCLKSIQILFYLFCVNEILCEIFENTTTSAINCGTLKHLEEEVIMFQKIKMDHTLLSGHSFHTAVKLIAKEKNPSHFSLGELLFYLYFI